MCMSCWTGAEVIAVQGVAGVAFARGGITRMHEQLTGEGSFERRRRAHQANAEFLSELGLDPDDLLGPAPTAAPHKASVAGILRPVLNGTPVPASGVV